MKIVLCCGSRSWTNVGIIDDTFTTLRDRYIDGISIIHGAARGADVLSGKQAKAFGWWVKEYPADWNRHGKGAGLIRNLHMLDQLDPKHDLVIAFWDGTSRGTKHTIDNATKRKIPVWIISDPD